MFKALLAACQGRVAEAKDLVKDDNAFAIIAQQIRDVTAGIAMGKRALALALVQDRSEANRLVAIEVEIADLESRAVAALRGDRADLAAHAAEVIATLEAERAAIREHRSAAAAEIDSLRATIRDAGLRLVNIERGRRIAAAAASVQRLRSRARSSGLSALAEAEANLQRLRMRQIEQADVDRVLDEIEGEYAPRKIAAHLEAQGFGPRTKISGGDVLERLRLKARKGACNGDVADTSLPVFPASKSV